MKYVLEPILKLLRNIIILVIIYLITINYFIFAFVWDPINTLNRLRESYHMNGFDEYGLRFCADFITD